MGRSLHLDTLLLLAGQRSDGGAGGELFLHQLGEGLRRLISASARRNGPLATMSYKGEARYEITTITALHATDGDQPVASGRKGESARRESESGEKRSE